MEHAKTSGAFVAWVPACRRSETLSRFLECDSLFIPHLIRSRGLLWKGFFWVDYLYKAVRTLAFLMRRKPLFVFVQSPPSFCPMVCFLYCRLFRKQLIVDAHNTTFSRFWIKVPLFLRTLQSSNAVIVHNREFLEHLRPRYPKVNFQLLNDRLPAIAHSKTESPSAEPYFLVILSYNADEPVRTMLTAFRRILREGRFPVQFWLTGNYRKMEDVHREFASEKGIRFLGFISDADFDRTLREAYGVIALTRSEMVQQCAVMEAIAAEIPTIASDTGTNRRLLNQGALLVSHQVQGIEQAVRRFGKEREVLCRGVQQNRVRLNRKWARDFTHLKKQLRL